MLPMATKQACLYGGFWLVKRKTWADTQTGSSCYYEKNKLNNLCWRHLFSDTFASDFPDEQALQVYTSQSVNTPRPLGRCGFSVHPIQVLGLKTFKWWKFQIMTDVVGNPEEERRADFYYLPWSQEAVCRYFYNKVCMHTYTHVELRVNVLHGMNAPNVLCLFS